ncbi:MAG: hypothetical protein E6935_16580 [Clostridium butyricum]|nr:hypothetical protein [Clostridium butyricum]
MNDMPYMVCTICGQRATELHHIMFRSQMKQLENCKLNFIYLCHKCHRGTNGVHGKNGHKLDKKFKLMFQNKLEILLTKEKLTREEIKETLGIKDKSIDNLCKLMKSEKGMFYREDVIRTLMNGKLIL